MLNIIGRRTTRENRNVQHRSWYARFVFLFLKVKIILIIFFSMVSDVYETFISKLCYLFLARDKTDLLSSYKHFCLRIETWSNFSVKI